MKLFYNKRDNERIVCTSDSHLLNYIAKHKLNTYDIEFLFDDGYTEQNEKN